MIIVIIGPTGVGKTKLSIELAKRLNAEIISGDSMQIYKSLDIATAKVTREEMDNVPHHLIDIANIEDVYTVYDYQRDCRRKIEEIQSRDKNVIIVGGTGLYIKAALYDYQFTEEKETYDFSNRSNAELLEEIKKNIPNTSVHINNRKRLERELTKIYNHSTNTNEGSNPLYNFIMIGLTLPRNELYTRIDKRVDMMVEHGLIEEARNLYNQNIQSKAINTGIGYKELYQYFDGKLTKEAAIELIKKNSRHYAKRQYTFFNNQFAINWFNVDINDFNKTIEEVYNFIMKED